MTRSKIAHDKQRNCCANVLRKTKNYYLSNISIRLITDKKIFENSQTDFLDKTTDKETIYVAENDIISRYN